MTTSSYTRRWRVVRGDDPAAGADWTLRAPGNATWRIVSLSARLVTSAAVANRRVRLIGDDQTRSWFVQHSGAVQAASITADYSAHTAAALSDSGTVFTMPLPAAGLLLRPGHRLLSSTLLIDVADQWSLISAMVDETPSDLPYVGDHGVVFSGNPEE